MFGADIATYNVENPAPDFGRLFGAATAMWLGHGPDAYPGSSVRGIRCPLLVVHGDDDTLVSRQQGYDLTAQVTGGASAQSAVWRAYAAGRRAGAGSAFPACVHGSGCRGQKSGRDVVRGVMLCATG
ncbi:hypothetical protein [Acetobacter conturbans]|uniref:hypothetical protein n=1 Tax=Acetobacter conturbans TaxID=1737472 RepID=UPI001F54D377|nr:hypothetical protein [Acetobacter conturbans]